MALWVLWISFIDFSKLLFFPIDEHVFVVKVGSLAQKSKRYNLKVARIG